MKPVALFDVDNTIYHGFSFTGVLESEVTRGILDQSVFDSCLQVLDDYKQGKAAYEASVLKLLQVHAKGLQGQQYSAVLRSARDFYGSTNNFYDFAKSTVELLRNTHDVILVTAEPEYACKAIREVMGVHLTYSSVYEISEGVFTGALMSTLSTRHDKHDAIAEMMRSYSKEHSFAFGDSEGDIEILRVVEHPICINASDGLAAEATAHGWPLVEPDNVTKVVKSILDS